ncbi:carbohydrate-binding module family 21 protein [Peniophora sp. CONT]|nr:carbohydrate-binding module family 21 protein [Peniophora sp. CONT]
MAATLPPSASRSSSYSRFGNVSSAPLPLIPRRHQNSPGQSRPTSRSTSPDRAVAVLSSPATPSIPASIIVQAPTPSPSPPALSDTRRASFESATPTNRVSRHNRSRGGQIPRSFFVLPPERSTPMPVAPVAIQHQTPSIDESTPRPRQRHPIPRELMMTPRPRPVSADAAEFSIEGQARGSRSVTMPASTSTPVLKLSNGKPLKSSLKSSSRPRLPLTVVTTPAPSTGGSKSAPATPFKNVHFDAKLEHVKLFLAEQKPLAVSRDGSPTDDFDTTDADEFPAFIYGKDNGKLVMQRVNFPETIAADSSADVALESVTLAADVQTVNGVVRVRNLAFEKWVAIRFTLDDWQTTSEVTARYISGVAGMPDLDRFAFVIKLHDLLPGRERSMMFAIRYTVLGREIWDSLGGQNYRLRFYHEPAALPKPPAPEPKSVAERQVEDLRSRLEAVVRKQQDGSEDGHPRSKETVGSLLAQHSRQRWQGSFSLSPSPVGTPLEEHESLPPLRFRNGSPLGSRYSFTDALRETKSLGPGSPPAHVRTNTFPSASNSVQWPRRDSPPLVNSARKSRMSMPLSPPPVRPASGFGSPRDAPEFSSVRVTDDEEDEVNTQPFARRSAPRMHSRGGGYFDLTKSSARLTPPATPLEEPQLLPPSLSMSPTPSPETSSTDLPDTPSQSSTDDEGQDGPDDLDADNIDTPATPRPGYARFTLGALPRAKSASPTPTLRGRAQTPLLSPGWNVPQLERTSSEDSVLSELSMSETASTLVRTTELTPRSSLAEKPEGERRSESPMNNLDNYAALLNKFCFYTGDASQIPRDSSSSSVEELFSSPRSESTYPRASPHYSPTTSGAATPVAAA